MSRNYDKLPLIVQKIAMYAKRDLWTAEKFGLSFCQSPGWSLSVWEVRGTQKNKSQRSFLACCNYDGSKKYPLNVLTHARRPSPFGKSCGPKVGFDYHSNSRTWMTKDICTAWAERLDMFAGQKHSRRALLWLSSCLAREGLHIHPVLRDVEIMYLPPSTISQFQPMDAKIIATVKAKYGRRLTILMSDPRQYV